MIKIETRKTGIPVHIGELEFSFDTSDEAVASLLQKQAIVVEKITAIKDGDDEGAKKALKAGFDLLLGPGAFKKIYAQTSSTIECIKYLHALLEAITAEFAAINPAASQQQRVENYLKYKNSKNKPKKQKRK